MKAVLIALYLFLPPILSRLSGGTGIAVFHAVVSSLGVAAIFLFSKSGLRFGRGSFMFTGAFASVALADLIYGFTSEIALDQNGLQPLVIVREFAYTGFVVLMSMGLTHLYRKELNNPRAWMVVSVLGIVFAWLGYSQIMVPLFQKPDAALLFVVNGVVYSLFRAFVLALVIKQMFFENNIYRFVFLFSLVQMFVCDFALNYQLNVLDGVETPLNAWFQTGWELSIASMFVVALLQRSQEFAFGQSVKRGLRSLRSMIAFLVISVLIFQGIWLWFFDFLEFSSLTQVAHFVSLAFAGFVGANVFGILVSRQVDRFSEGSLEKLKSFKAIWVEEFEDVLGQVLSLQRRHDDEKWLTKLGEVVAQVSHDIRSPLSALNMVVSVTDNLPEDRRLIIRNATQRINDIANHLLQSSNQHRAETRDKFAAMEPCLLAELIDSIISEKRVQFRQRLNVEIVGELKQGYGLFSQVDELELGRALSNLINNAVEACQEQAKVFVCVRRSEKMATIVIQDNGHGIPADVLSRLGKQRISSGKAIGSGLGVFHAKQLIERAGGRLEIQSVVSVGTTVTLLLPIADPPNWFLKEISLSEFGTIVSVDDDQTIHQIWDGRLSVCQVKPAHVSLSSVGELKKWLIENHAADTLFLIDYEFSDQGQNGLDAIAEFGIQKNAVLVTSRFNQKDVRGRAQTLGVRILPKSLSPFVPFGPTVTES